MTTPDQTRNRILDKAEELFAARGIDAVSLRELTSAAGVNLAAVHYHFGSKEDLVTAIMARRVVPVNEQRLEHLDEVESRGPLGEESIEAVVEAFVRPALVAFAEPGHFQFFCMMARLAVGGGAHTHPQFENVFGEVRDRFLGALAATRPDLDPACVSRIFSSMLGALIMPLARTRTPIANTQIDARVRELVSFIAAGIRATADGVAREGEVVKR